MTAKMTWGFTIFFGKLFGERSLLMMEVRGGAMGIGVEAAPGLEFVLQDWAKVR